MKDEISKKCKDFKTKKIFEGYLEKIDENNKNDLLPNNQNINAVNNLKNFDAHVDAGRDSKLAVKKFIQIKDSKLVNSSSKVHQISLQNITKLLSA